MRFLYIDIDSLRPDHLGAYGYHRNTSPNIDSIARDARVFEQVYVSDAPCLPSRTAMFSGRFGIHTGVVGHGGTAADPFLEGESRGFGSQLSRHAWPRLLRNTGMYCASISPFMERHSAYHVCAGFNEILNPGRRGLESAHEITPLALDWLKRNASRDNWFLHLNYWDPHTPYRAPEEFGNPFAQASTPSWLSEEVRREHFEGCGPHSAQETIGYSEVSEDYKRNYPRQPWIIDSSDAVRRMFDGYDTGVLYADQAVGQVVDLLRQMGIYEDCAILVSADHGENLGELNIYGDHQCADEFTCRVPAILKWPGILPGRDTALHYQIDIAATIVQLCGGEIPQTWNGQSFSDELSGAITGRDHLILSQGAWSCQRSVRFRKDECEWLYMRSYHDGHHAFPDEMLFNLSDDPHEQHDLASSYGQLVAEAGSRLLAWQTNEMRQSANAVDPLWTVIREGGPKHTKNELVPYLQRLRATGRGHWADVLEAKHS